MKLAEGRQKTRSKVLVVNSSDVDNIRLKRGIPPGFRLREAVSSNATYNNPDDIPDIVRFFQKRGGGLTVIGINSVEPKGLRRGIRNGKPSVILTLMSEYTESILSGKDPGVLRKFFDHDLKVIISRDTRTMPEQLPLNGCCYPGNRKLFVDTDGVYYMCEKFGRRVPIGDAEDGIDSEIIDQAIDRFLDIRNIYCRGCWAQRLCTPCIQLSKNTQGDISREGLDQTCPAIRSTLMVALTNYVSLNARGKKQFDRYMDSIQTEQHGGEKCKHIEE